MIFGEAVQTAIDKYLDILTIAFIGLLVVGFVAIRLLARQRHPVSKAAGD